jgi:hypothetical protein
MRVCLFSRRRSQADTRLTKDKRASGPICRTTFHAIVNPLERASYAIHLYGGDLLNFAERSVWNLFTLEKHSYDMKLTSDYAREPMAEARNSPTLCTQGRTSTRQAKDSSQDTMAGGYFSLACKQNEWAEHAVVIADRELAPRAAKTGRAGTFPSEGLEILKREGFWKLRGASEHGGLEGSLLTTVLVTEILAKRCVSTSQC